MKSVTPTVNPGKPLSLRANFSWTFVGNIVYVASQWGILVVIAKLGTPEMVGQFALALAVTAPIIIFTNLKLRSVQATDAKQDYQFSDYLSLRLITTFLAFVLILIIVILGNYRAETAGVILIIGLAKCFEALSDIYYGLFQQRERMDRIAKSMMIKGPLSLIMMGLGLWITNDILWACIGLTLTRLLILIVYDIPQSKFARQFDLKFSLTPSFHTKHLRPLVWLTLPLGFVAMLISLKVNIPNYILVEYVSEAQLGIFATLSYVIVAQSVLINSNSQATLPRLARDFSQNNFKGYYNLLFKLATISILISVISIVGSFLFGEIILEVLYNAEYAKYHVIFTLLMIVALFINIASILNYAMLATRKFIIQIPLYSIVITSIIIIGMMTIPQYGMIGMLITIIVSTILQILGNLAVIIYYVNQSKY